MLWKLNRNEANQTKPIKWNGQKRRSREKRVEIAGQISIKYLDEEYETVKSTRCLHWQWISKVNKNRQPRLQVTLGQAAALLDTTHYCCPPDFVKLLLPPASCLARHLYYSACRNWLNSQFMVKRQVFNCGIWPREIQVLKLATYLQKSLTENKQILDNSWKVKR